MGCERTSPSPPGFRLADSTNRSGSAFRGAVFRVGKTGIGEETRRNPGGPTGSFFWETCETTVEVRCLKPQQVFEENCVVVSIRYGVHSIQKAVTILQEVLKGIRQPVLTAQLRNRPFHQKHGYRLHKQWLNGTLHHGTCLFHFVCLPDVRIRRNPTRKCPKHKLEAIASRFLFLIVTENRRVGHLPSCSQDELEEVMPSATVTADVELQGARPYEAT